MSSNWVQLGDDIDQTPPKTPPYHNKENATTMGNTSSSHKISAQDRAILDLKNQRDKLHQYQKRITTLTDRETQIARECLARNDRQRALLALRRKKYQQSLLAKTDAQLDQLERLTGNVEFALVQKDVLFGLSQGTKVLQTIHKEMGGLEGVEKLMGDTEEARAYQEEVSRMLSGQMSNQDEDEVEDELEAMEQEISGPVSLPNVPTSALHEETERERQEKAKQRAKARAKARAPVPMEA
ncbi:charged multivesicular body protein 6 [Blastomyces parvus]|uniref:Charged multivesicular body protein 6 n=1 Tax=Blastomyces parvus TaxID=2060905 RepID=A0A2B7XAQ8_9EURO|nr:charged multivesicular body protein 6 [Blastomyces parvus]